MKQKCAAEILGTYILVFSGTGAAIVNDISGHAVTHVGVALTFGLVVLAMIYTFGDISGAHINPAVSIGFCVARRMPWSMLPAYVISQVVGALAASATLRTLFPTHPTLGSTIPAGSDMQSFVLEFILTAILMFVALSVSTGAKEKGITAGIVVGAVIAFEALFGGPISGASMNPARSLAPAVVSDHLEGLWIYLLAPTSGAVLAVMLFCGIHGGCGGTAIPDAASDPTGS